MMVIPLTEAQQSVVRVLMPAQDLPPLWIRDNVTDQVSGLLPDILEEIVRVVKLNYTISFSEGSYSGLGNI